MKKRFEKRKFDRMVKNAARSLTSEIMFNEYTDMVANNRERTPSRLEWLEGNAPYMACNRFSCDSTESRSTTTALFMKHAKNVAKDYMQFVVLKMEKELAIAKEKAEKGA